MLAVMARGAEEDGVEGESGVHLGRLDDFSSDEEGCEGWRRRAVRGGGDGVVKVGLAGGGCEG